MLNEGHWGGQGKGHQIKGDTGGAKEEEGGGNTIVNTWEEGEDV